MIDQMRKTLHDICNGITSGNLEELKFLTEDKFGDGKLEKIKEPLHFVKLVMENYITDEESVLCMSELLNEIGRKDLARKLKKCLLCSIATTLEGPVSSYVHRQELHSQVTEIIHSNKNVKVIALIGMVGIGKTEIMKQICIELQENNIVVQPTEGSDKTQFVPILRSIHDILKHISYDVKPEKSSIIKCLKELESPFILSLDIAKVPHTGHFCNNIKKFINEVQSIPNCKLILTSARYSCKNCHKNKDNTISIFVPPLNFQESFSTLEKQRVYWHPSFTADIINDCQGIPIHLENIIDNVEGPLVRQSFPINTSKFVADEAFKTYLKNCDTQIKKSLVYLYHIKDEFPLELAVVILDIEIQSAMNICTILQKEQLLVQRGGRYHMPWIVQYYIISILNTRKDLREIAKEAKCSLIKLLVGFLYRINDFFMGYPCASECRLFDELLNEANSNLCRSCPAVQAIEFYKRYKRSFNWALKEGISDKSLKLAEVVADCANECVSFLAKAMEKPAIIDLYQKVKKCSKIKKNKIRSACTLVSIAFLKMYHNGCDSEPVERKEMLQTALESLCMADNFESSSEHFHLQEVAAHCYSKLGHIIAAQSPESFDKGLKMIYEAINIRELEVKRGSGSRALVGAGYVDIAKIYGHQKKYEEAEKHCIKALGIYRKELGKHPFVATTMNYLAETYQKLGNAQKSSKFSLIAKNLSRSILGEHLDTARFLRQHADVVAMKDKDCAVALYKAAKDIGEHRMGKKELIDMLNDCTRLCDEKEADYLREEIAKFQRSISVEWRAPNDDCCGRSMNGAHRRSMNETAHYTRDFLPLHLTGRMVILALFIVFALYLLY